MILIGIPLVAAALIMSNPNPARHAVLTASFAATAGMLYGSFFGKLVDLDAPASTNIEIGVLTALIGMAFVSSVIGMINSIYLSGRSHDA